MPSPKVVLPPCACPVDTGLRSGAATVNRVRKQHTYLRDLVMNTQSITRRENNNHALEQGSGQADCTMLIDPRNQLLSG